MTGLVLSLHYQNGRIEAFDSVCHIHRDVNRGWFYRIVHFNGASGFFICVYLHVFRGLYYGSFILKKVWTRGTVILLLLMATAFVGYVLPYGQIRFWGATVITNLIRAVPYFGVDLVYWVWGGFAVGNATVLRFFVFHFLLPFVIALVVVSHLLFLHETGSRNPLGVRSDAMKLRFYPFYILKDLFGMVLFLIMFYFLVMLNPYFFGDCENFYLANPISTPVHIKPEWYFLWAYAILRSVPRKVGGVVLLALSVMVLFIIVFFRNKFQGKFYYPFRQFWFWLFVVVVALLT